MAAAKKGRPSKYSQEIADELCNLIASSNRGIAFHCENLNIAPSSVYKWLAENKEFSELYAHAREAQAEFLADEILEIADDSSRDTKTIYKGDTAIEVENTEWVNRSKLRVDARKWIAAKLKPRKYGDKLDVTTDGEKITAYSIGFKKPEDEN